MRNFLLFLFVLATTALVAQEQTATFEGLVTGPGEVYNGSENTDFTNTFIDGGVRLEVTFQEFPGGFTSWNDFAISSVSDTVTPGFMNQYAARPGSGFGGSLAYAVSFGNGARMYLAEEVQGQPVTGMYLTNTTYAYYSIRDGDDFSAAFGGETGDDPDYFELIIKGYQEGSLTTDSVVFTLADYRFDDNSQDYIVDEWEFVDLTSLGAVDSLEFTYFTTNVNDFGPVTPLYFCVDNVITAEPTSVSETILNPLCFYPNPTVDFVYPSEETFRNCPFRLYDQSGRTLVSGQTKGAIDLRGLNSGLFYVEVETRKGTFVQRIVKR